MHSRDSRCSGAQSVRSLDGVGEGDGGGEGRGGGSQREDALEDTGGDVPFEDDRSIEPLRKLLVPLLTSSLPKAQEASQPMPASFSSDESSATDVPSFY
jgi:hypothetical protein